jgi:hypothetical protein
VAVLVTCAGRRLNARLAGSVARFFTHRRPLVIDSKQKPPPRRSRASFPGWRRCLFGRREDFCGAVDGTASHACCFTRFVPSAEQPQKTSYFNQIVISQRAEGSLWRWPICTVQGIACKNIAQCNMSAWKMSSSPAPDFPGGKVAGDVIGIEGRPGESADPIGRLAHHVRLGLSNRGVIEIRTEDRLRRCQQLGR